MTVKQVRTCATIVKKDPAEKTGITFGQKDGVGGGEEAMVIVIAGIKADSPFSTTGIKAGMRVISINGRVQTNARNAAMIIGQCPAEETIVASSYLDDSFTESTEEAMDTIPVTQQQGVPTNRAVVPPESALVPGKNNAVTPPHKDAFTLTVTRRSKMLAGGAKAMVYVNDVFFANLKNGGTCVVKGYKGDNVQILQQGGGASFKVNGTGPLRLRMKVPGDFSIVCGALLFPFGMLCVPATYKYCRDGVRFTHCRSDNPDLDRGVFTDWEAVGPACI